MLRKSSFGCLVALLWAASFNLVMGDNIPTLLSVRKIWDKGNHNAFTDLIRFQDQWYCTFREAEAHVGGDGSIRVLRSADGREWSPVANISEAGIDLRDPKLSITPDGRLMIVAGGSVYKGGKTLLGRQPRVLFSKDGENWTAPKRTLEEGDWLWRVTWHKGTAWGLAYNPQARMQEQAKAAANQGDPVKPGPAEWKLKLVKSTDGEHYDLVTHLDVPGFANESTVRFLDDDTMVALIRRESGNRKGWIGTSKPPYKTWEYHETNYRLGGPNFLVMDDGAIWASSRDHREKAAKTSIGRMSTTDYEPELVLPSGGDNSYAGMVMHEGELWMSYYSSHEGKSSIYLARLQLPKGRDIIKPAAIIKPTKMLMVGDSTMSSYAKPPADRPTLTGWGQVFGGVFKDQLVEVTNKAVSGMSTKTCLESGHWEKTLKEDGDYILIQFGHNDQPGKAKSSPAETTFRDNLKRMITDARRRAMKPVLITPVARRTFDKSGRATSTLGPYAEAVKAVGKEMKVPVLDLHQASFDLFQRLGDSASADFSPAATDRSHFSRQGAEKIAALVAELIRGNEDCADLASRLKSNPK